MSDAVTTKAKQYSLDYLNDDYHKSMYTAWKICPWMMDETFSKGHEIHPSLAMQMGTINHEFHGKLFGWVDEYEMFKCTTYPSTYKYLIQFVPMEAPVIIKNGMLNIINMETLRWVDLMHKADNPWFWWEPYAIEENKFINEYPDYRMVGKIDWILRHYPYEDQFEIWELKAKLDLTRVRWDLSFYYRMINEQLKVVYWGAFGYHDGDMLYEPVNNRSLKAFDKAWPNFLQDVKDARSGKELIKKPLASSFGSGFIPPICTYCHYQVSCYGDWKKEY